MVYYNSFFKERNELTTVLATESTRLDDVKRIGTGLAFILFPLLFALAFAVHPGLLNPHQLSPQELILRAHQNPLLAFGHVLVLFDAAIMVVVTLHLMKRLDGTSVAWAGLVGAALVVLSAVMLGAEKGAESLTISALDTLPENQFAQMMPGLVAIFAHQGWMALVMGVDLLAVGFTIQAIALLKTNIIPRWQSALLLIGIWMLGWPDGEEIYALTGSMLLAVAFVPYGMKIIRKGIPAARTHQV
jgi:hypothetical protein